MKPVARHRVPSARRRQRGNALVFSMLGLVIGGIVLALGIGYYQSSQANAQVQGTISEISAIIGSAQQTASSLGGTGETARANAREISAKAIAFAEKNMQASLAYAQQLVHAKDLPEVMRLHTEYVQAQMRALTEQASEMGQAVTKAALDSTKLK